MKFVKHMQHRNTQIYFAISICNVLFKHLKHLRHKLATCTEICLLPTMDSARSSFVGRRREAAGSGGPQSAAPPASFAASPLGAGSSAPSRRASSAASHPDAPLAVEVAAARAAGHAVGPLG
jgi:hypothetical protein